MFTLPLAEDRFPRVIPDESEEQERPRNVVQSQRASVRRAPYGSDGNRGTCQELIIRDCSFKYSHYQPFQKGDERHDWPNALYDKTRKCNSNVAGYDCIN